MIFFQPCEDDTWYTIIVSNVELTGSERRSGGLEPTTRYTGSTESGPERSWDETTAAVT